MKALDKVYICVSMKNLILLLPMFFISGSLFAQTESGISQKEEKKIFVNACVDGFINSPDTESLGIKERKLKKAAKKYCTCSYNTVKSKGYTMAQLNEMNRDELVRITQSCLDELLAKIMPK